MDLINPPAAPSAWSDEVKAQFKARGIEDIDLALAERETQRVELEQRRQALENAQAILAKEDALDDYRKEMLRRLRDGEDVVDFVRKQPNIDLSKTADKIDPVTLVDAHFPGAISEDDKQVLRDNNDPDALADVQKRLQQWQPLAAAKHDAARQAPLHERAQKEAAQKAWNEKYNNGIAANVAALPQGMKTLATPEVVQALAQGKFIESFIYEADGTYKPTALSDGFWLRDRTAILKTARDVGYAEGLEQGRLQSLSRLPNTAGGGPERAPNAPPAQQPSGSDDFYRSVTRQP
jgi:hypothetical protein